MTIHGHLTRIPKRDLQQIRWTKVRKLVRVARADGQRFDCARRGHKASELPKEEFQRVVEQHLTGRESEPWELLYFRVTNASCWSLHTPSKRCSGTVEASGNNVGLCGGIHLILTKGRGSPAPN